MRPYSKSDREKMARLMTLATLIPSSVADVQVNLHSHANILDVSIYMDGWSDEKEPVSYTCIAGTSTFSDALSTVVQHVEMIYEQSNLAKT